MLKGCSTDASGVLPGCMLAEGERWSLAVILVGGLVEDYRNPRVSAGGSVEDRGGQGGMEFRALRVSRALGHEVA